MSQAGHKSVIVQTIGFLCDHVEILYDIDIAFREFAAGLGMRLERTESLNGSPILTEALADLSGQALDRLSDRWLSGSPPIPSQSPLEADAPHRHHRRRPQRTLHRLRTHPARPHRLRPLRSHFASRRNRRNPPRRRIRHRVRRRFLGNRETLGTRTRRRARHRRRDHPLQRRPSANLSPRQRQAHADAGRHEDDGAHRPQIDRCLAALQRKRPASLPRRALPRRGAKSLCRIASG